MSLHKVLSVPALIVWTSLVLVPVSWPYFPTFEARILPVVSMVEDVVETPGNGGVSFYVRFAKYRQCDFIGINWYDGSRRLMLHYHPSTENQPRTRPAGDQHAGPWFLEGVASLEGTRATVVHQCHPLWKTHTPFYE